MVTPCFLPHPLPLSHRGRFALDHCLHCITLMQAAEVCKQMGEETLVAIDAQGRQLNRMNAEFDEVHDRADHAESSLRWLGRCCWCCNCFRAPPSPKKGWGGQHIDRRPEDTSVPHRRGLVHNQVRSLVCRSHACLPRPGTSYDFWMALNGIYME
jgi:hypothetical protein